MKISIDLFFQNISDEFYSLVILLFKFKLMPYPNN